MTVGSVSALMARLGRHAPLGIGSLATAAVVSRVLLIVFSPRAFGYVWDYYHQAVVVFYETGQFPTAEACWQCYHPPLFYAVGLPFYAFGRWMFPDSPHLPIRVLSLVSVGSAAIATYYSYRLIALFETDRGLRVLGLGLVVSFPCLFISAYGVEADILLTALMTVFMYHLARYTASAEDRTSTRAVGLGIAAGLAVSTKYSGLIAPVAALCTFVLLIMCANDRRRIARHALIAAALCALLGSWKYLDNLQRYGTPLFANGSAANGFALGAPRRAGAHYDFWTFRLTDLLALSSTDAPPGPLTSLPIYRSVSTTLYGLAWSDMGFFSRRSRHGDPAMPYPDKHVPAWLISSVLLLAIVPTTLAVPGFVIMLTRRVYAALWITALVTIVSYVAWFTAQEEWALKTKYILFLLPVYILAAVCGLRWSAKYMSRLVLDGTILLLLLLIVVAHLYQVAFALGHL